MSAIKTISGVPDQSQPTSGKNEKQQIQETVPDNSVQNTPIYDLENRIEKPKEVRSEDVSSSSFATYEEAMEVAEKLQARLLEITDNPQKVSIRIDEEVDQYIIEIKDSQGNVVKQFPPEKVLNLHKKLADLSGMVIDEMI